MRYLTLAADYGEVSIRDPLAGALTPNELGLPDELVADLAAWNGRYQPVVSADEMQRGVEPMASLIPDLDAEGLRLARRIADALEGEAKVRYYSEGLLKEVM